MSRKEKAKELFNQWEQRFPDDAFGMKTDGIVDEVKYNKAIPKILFITKEPNDPNKEKGDYATWWQEDGINYPFSRRLAEWSSGLLRNFPLYDEVKFTANPERVNLLKDSLASIAFMNLKKIGGTSVTNNNKLLVKYIIPSLDLILEQIKLIKPEIIITGVSTEGIRNTLFGKDQWVESGYAIKIKRFGEAKVIDFYHPSSRMAGSASYSLLGNIVKSDAFKTL